MTKSRDTSKYRIKYDGKLVRDETGKPRRGITSRPLEEREREHQDEYPGCHLEKVGRLTTRDGALSWERGET